MDECLFSFVFGVAILLQSESNYLTELSIWGIINQLFKYSKNFLIVSSDISDRRFLARSNLLSTFKCLLLMKLKKNF